MLLAMSRFGFSYATLVEKATAAHKIGWQADGPRPAAGRPGERHLARHGADVRHRRPAPHPHALLHRHRRQGGPQVGALRLRLRGLLLQRHLPDGALAPSSSSGSTRPSSRAAQIGGKLVGGGNMVAMHLAKAVGGNLLLGFLAAVAFATILAVVSGLALAGASAISHDLYARVIKKGQVSEADGDPRLQDRHHRPRHRRHRARHPLREAERGLHGRPRLRRRGRGQLPGAHPLHVLEGAHHPRRARGRLRRPPLRRDLRAALEVGLGGGAGQPAGRSSPTTSRPSSPCPSPSSWPGRARSSTRSARATLGDRWPSRTSTSGPRPASAPPAPASTDPGGRRAGLRAGGGTRRPPATPSRRGRTPSAGCARGA